MPKISSNMLDWRILLENELKLRGYSRRTIKSYSYYVGNFIASKKDPKEFLLDMINKKKQDETVRLAGFAIKFFLKISKKDDRIVDEIIEEIPNVKRPKKLPIVLAKKEIEAMIISTHNLKHRLLIQLGYSAGLRASEIINLRWKDIDFKRNTIHIKQSKGKKDRIVMLSPKVKKGLKRLTLNKGGYVFKTNRAKKYSHKSIEFIIKNAAKKAGINKRVTPHTLRHSFATHLLENGVDIKFIKELLGHSNLQTTMIYTKMSKRDMSRIKSPLDS